VSAADSSSSSVASGDGPGLAPTLLLGLGGSGVEVLLRVRRLFHEHCGHLQGNLGSAVLGYLALDTDGGAFDRMAGETVGENVLRDIRLRTDAPDPEALDCSIRPQELMAYFLGGMQSFPHIFRWLQPELNRHGEAAVVTGTRSCRSPSPWRPPGEALLPQVGQERAVLMQVDRLEPAERRQLCDRLRTFSVPYLVRRSHPVGGSDQDRRSLLLLGVPDSRSPAAEWLRTALVDQSRGSTLAMGTPEYLSPEQAEGTRELTPASDLYALGVVLYELLTGVSLFRRKTPLASAHTHVHDRPLPPRQLNEEIPEALEDVVLRCLDKDPERRLRSARELYEALQSW
jgi:serine/threonine protein kinase